MATESTKVTPADLDTLATQLTTAGNELQESLDMFHDPAMWTTPEAYKDDFGPATATANSYAQVVHQLLPIVNTASDRLNHGGEVFHAAAAGFANTDDTHGKRIKHAGPR